MHVRKFFTRFAIPAAVLVLASGNTPAAPDDDYKTGAASFVVGDFVGAMPFLRKAAEAGYAPAQAMYGQLLLGTAQEDEAVRYFRKSADQQNTEGEFYYGTSLLTGEGIKKNPLEARKWIQMAAEKGWKDAENQMALIALEPSQEQPMDNTETLRWLKKSADNNFLPAITGLVAAYQKGLYGLTVDPHLADEYQAKSNKLQGIDDSAKRKRRGPKK